MAAPASNRPPGPNRRLRLVRGTQRAHRRTAAALRAGHARLRRPVLTGAGLGCLAAAGYHLNLTAGLLATGAACLVFEWLGGD